LIEKEGCEKAGAANRHYWRTVAELSFDGKKSEPGDAEERPTGAKSPSKACQRAVDWNIVVSGMCPPSVAGEKRGKRAGFFACRFGK
jgi:hypothetical protein